MSTTNANPDTYPNTFHTDPTIIPSLISNSRHFYTDNRAIRKRKETRSK